MLRGGYYAKKKASGKTERGEKEDETGRQNIHSSRSVFIYFKNKLSGQGLRGCCQIVLCHPELDSGSHNLLILLDAETSSA